MTNRSSIEWTEVTWKPVTGSIEFNWLRSLLCATLAKRLKAMEQPSTSRTAIRVPWTRFEVSVHPKHSTSRTGGVHRGWSSSTR